tara:strand:+ start:341 stop:802 length:462 start_codon:yes stop_codon:yes gene_type:complete
MSNKLSIKEEMRAIDQRDVGWWDSLTEEEQKKVGIWILMRYTSACDSNHDQIRDHYLTMTNDLVNVQFNTLRHHPQLQHRLLQIVGIGKSQYHPWIPPGKRQKKNKVADWLIKLYPSINDDELDILLQSTKAELKRLAEQTGMTDKDIKALFK